MAALFLGRRAFRDFRRTGHTDDDSSVLFVDFMIYLANCGIQDGMRAVRVQRANDLIISMAQIIEVTRYDSHIWLDDELLGTPIMRTAKGKCRKISREYKMAVIRAVAAEPQLQNPKAAMAGMKIWGKRKKGTLAAKNRGRGWDWDVFFGHMSSGWALMPRVGSICMTTDAVWLSGEDTSYYNFLDPISDVNVWSPVQVT